MAQIYVSAAQALDWMFANKLVQVGTLVMYDDFMDYSCATRLGSEKADLFDSGEPKAHREAAIKYGVQFRCVAGACAAPTDRPCDLHAATYGAIFVVVGLGGKPDDGFEMDAAQLFWWKRRHKFCNFVRHYHKTWRRQGEKPRPGPRV